MSRTHRVRWFKLLVAIGTALVAILSLGLIAAAPSSAPAGTLDRQASAEEQPDDQHELFGFGKPVAASANTPSSTEPGDTAVVLAKGLKATLISDKVGEDADMIALWPNDDKPT